MPPTMARKKKKKASGKHAQPREAFHLPVELQLALECEMALANLPTTKSRIIRECLDEAMRAKGRLPLQADQLKKMVEAIGLEHLAPHEREYLLKMGIGDAK